MKALILSLSLSLAFGGAALAKSKEARKPNATEKVVMKVKAASIEEAWKKVAANPKVKKVLEKTNSEYKDCDGSLGDIDKDHVINYYGGKSSASDRVAKMLVPLWGSCGGSGMIETMALMANFTNYFAVEDEESTYEFHGFVRVTNLPISSGNQAAFPGL